MKLSMDPLKPGALAIITMCFVGSGVVRLLDNAPAIAREAGAFAERGATAMEAQQATMQAEPLSCPEPEEAGALLAAIQERVVELDARELQLANREQVLRVSKLMIEDKLAALKQAEERMADLFAVADQASEKDIERITSVYENMKAENAAQIFETMDVTFAAGFLMRMRPGAAAAILANLPPDTAYAVSVVMAGRNASSTEKSDGG